MSVSEDEEKQFNEFTRELDLFIDRYGNIAYKGAIKKFVNYLVGNFRGKNINVPDSALQSEDSFKRHLTLITYDNSGLIGGYLDKNIEVKKKDFKEGFYNEIARLTRAAYIHIFSQESINADNKIFFGELFISLIENISFIENINIDEFIKAIDFIKAKNLELKTEGERLAQLVMEAINNRGLKTLEIKEHFDYWQHSLQDLQRFEQLLIKYSFIYKHDNFIDIFKEKKSRTNDKLIVFRKERAKCYYILYSIYGELYMNGEPINKVVPQLFLFQGKMDSPTISNSSWTKFQTQTKGNFDKYIQRKMKDAYDLIQELNLSSNK